MAWLTVLTTLLPLLLFTLALRQNVVSTHQFHDAANCAFLRGRCLLVYCQTQNDAALTPSSVVQGELRNMRQMRSSLRADYPGIIPQSDTDSYLFNDAVAKCGQVDWPTAYRLFTDYDHALIAIRVHAYYQDHCTNIALIAGLVGMLVSIGLSYVTLRGLAFADAQQSHLASILNATSDIITSVDANLNVVYVNDSFRRLIEVDQQAVITREQDFNHFSKTTHPTLKNYIETDAPHGRNRLTEGELVNAAGEHIPVSLVLMTHLAADGTILGHSNIARDISHVKAVETQLRSSRERLEQAQSLAGVGSWVLNLATGELDWSDEMRRIAGVALNGPLPSVEEFFTFIHVVDRERVSAAVQGVIDAVGTGDVANQGYDIEYRFAHADGEVVFVRSTCQVAYYEGNATMLVGATVDVTDAKMAEQEYRRLASIVESTDQMIVATTLDGMFVSWNRGAERIYGFSAADVIGRNASFLSPENPRFFAEITERVLSGERVENVEVVRTRKGGEVIDVSLNFSPVFDPFGEIVAIATMGRDITARKRAEEALRTSEEQLAAAQKAAKLGSWTFNVVTGEINWSEELFHMLGFDPALGAPSIAGYAARYHPDDLPGHKERLANALANGIGYTVDARLYNVQGELRWMQITAKPIQNENGQVVHMIGTMLDITTRKLAEEKMRDYAVALEFKQSELERSNEQLARLATQDGLTNLKNHRAFQERLSEEIERAQRYDSPLSLMLIDVDSFKQYNDHFGHPEGDIVLKKVAAMMEEAARHTDIVARYGGEEFVIVLPQTSSSGCAVVAERLRAMIAAAEWPNRAVTVSIGVCAMHGNNMDQSRLISCADEALYESKHAGRNRVTIYDEEKVVLKAA